MKNCCLFVLFFYVFTLLILTMQSILEFKLDFRFWLNCKYRTFNIKTVFFLRPKFCHLTFFSVVLCIKTNKKWEKPGNQLHSLGPGEVVLVSMPADGPPGGWQHSPTNNQGFTTATSFTQQDINEGSVWYRHFGGGTNSDSFQFQVSTDAHTVFTVHCTRVSHVCQSSVSLGSDCFVFIKTKENTTWENSNALFPVI